MGDIAQAAEEFRKLPAADTEQAAGRQWIDLVKSLASGAGAVGYSGSRPDERLIQDVQERLGAVPERARRILTTVTSLQSAMHGILRDRLLRAVYQNQEDTFQLRVDLGEYYLTQKRFNDAIRQFRQVLSIDPWNIGALFRLGRVYAMKGNWKQALANYEKVYYSDPTYENVLHRYNELARRHPDTFSFGVRSTSDTQRLIYQGSADFLTHLNSLFGLELNYTVGSQRLFVAPAPELPSTFQTNSVTLGVPIDLYGVHLKITPKFGVTVVNHLDGDTVARNLPTSTSLSPASYFGYLSLDPTARIDGALNIGKYLSITATYAYGRQPETYVPSRLRYNIFDNSAEMNVSTNLGFLGGYPFKSSSFRAYGRMDVLSDADIIYTALGELTLGIVNLQKFSTVISLVGNAQLQNSTRTPQPSYLYYAPKGEVVAGGGFQGSTWLPVGTDTLGLSLRAIASSYMQQIFSSANLTKLLQLSGEGRVEYDRGNSSVYLDTSFSATYQYDPVLAAPQSPWNYWSLAVSLGYSAQLPSLLTP
jgi:tetratricopeptide (TPR) repeat protein